MDDFTKSAKRCLHMAFGKNSLHIFIKNNISARLQQNLGEAYAPFAKLLQHWPITVRQ